MSYDAVLTATDFVIHAPDCPEVIRARQLNQPLMTMLDCTTPIPIFYRRHQCFQEPQ